MRAARLLAEIGDARGRFATVDSLACLAGVAPSTRQSGNVTAVSFRWGADKQLRDAPISTNEPAPAATTTPTPCAF